MACALSQGIVLDCRDSMGGVKHVFIMEWANLDGTAAITEASGVITAIDKVATKRFWKYQLPKNTAVAGSAMAGSEENGTVVWTPTISIVANKLQASVRNEIKLLAQNRVVMVVVDMNNKGWLFGKENALTLTEAGSSTGTAGADRNGYTMTFAGQEREPEVEVDSATLATLETPGV